MDKTNTDWKGLNVKKSIISFGTNTSSAFAFPQSQFNMSESQACQTAVELLWRLHKLKTFVQELNWPEPIVAHDLNEQVRILCAQLLREALKQ